MTADAGQVVSGERRVITSSGWSISGWSIQSLRAQLASFLRKQTVIKAKITLLEKQIASLQKKIDDRTKKNLSTALYKRQLLSLMDSHSQAEKLASDIQKKIDDVQAAIAANLK